MLRLSAALAIGLLGACKQEPSFDERYKAAEQRMNASASAIDKELAAASQSEPATSDSAPKAQDDAESQSPVPNP